jgi:hypothetical protein
MSVYVDPIFEWHNGKRWCHMIADTEAELLRMATRLGLRHEWLHVSNSGVHHFDLTPVKRGLAIAYGAEEITGKQLVEITTRQRWEALKLSQDVAPFPEMDEYLDGEA